MAEASLLFPPPDAASDESTLLALARSGSSFLGYPPRPFDAPETLVAARLPAGSAREAYDSARDPLRTAPRLDLEHRRWRRVRRHRPPRVERTVHRPMSTKRALLSVSDRSGLLDLANALLRHGFELVSTGGTGKHLSDAGLPVTQVADVTGFPEVFDGRVKTLHPALFGGVLYDRSVPKHVEQAGENGIGPIDVVVVNLYPFEETVASLGDDLRAGDREDRRRRAVAPARRRQEPRARRRPLRPGRLPRLRRRARRERAAARPSGRGRGSPRRSSAGRPPTTPRSRRGSAARTEGEAFPERLPLSFELGGTLRYGENPHQAGAFYRDPAAPPSALARFVLHQGKELSYTNLLDADSALFTSRLLPRGAPDDRQAPDPVRHRAGGERRRRRSRRPGPPTRSRASAASSRTPASSTAPRPRR